MSGEGEMKSKLKASVSYLCSVAMLVAGLVSMPTVMAADAAEFADDYVPTVLITGSNRGIGLEFAQQYAERGWTVIATARKPAQADALNALASKYDNFIVEQLDVTDFNRVDALAAKYAEMPIDLLLHNAGISGGSDKQIFTKMEYDVFAKVLEVNTIAPLKISEAFYSHVKASRDKKIVTVSSSEGSINGASQPRLYFYRSSKAALNMVMVNLALQLKRKGISVGMVNPGMTDTDFMAGLPKKMLRPTADAVTDMIRNIDALTIETTGSFYQYDGTIIPW
ncbi:MAG: short-chain dehydrogenase [Chromatiales bacterium]|jgi:NAD(P)-dependent dehydrogenase (short-subunit alcohol dehydrogenase family)|nr:short-chain dehydrogenase [Chromatiales bacterium]